MQHTQHDNLPHKPNERQLQAHREKISRQIERQLAPLVTDELKAEWQRSPAHVCLNTRKSVALTKKLKLFLDQEMEGKGSPTLQRKLDKLTATVAEMAVRQVNDGIKRIAEKSASFQKLDTAFKFLSLLNPEQEALVLELVDMKLDACSKQEQAIMISNKRFTSRELLTDPHAGEHQKLFVYSIVEEAFEKALREHD